MPFRFRKSLKLGKGFKLNLSKSGISTSIGKRGASVNISKRGVKTTVGIPGTGISHTTGGGSSRTRSRKGCCSMFALLPLALLFLLIIVR